MSIILNLVNCLISKQHNCEVIVGEIPAITMIEIRTLIYSKCRGYLKAQSYKQYEVGSVRKSEYTRP